jgi:ABC-type transporter Mla subunit MlaD
MTEISILRAIESTNAVNRVLGEALGEALTLLEHIGGDLPSLHATLGGLSRQLAEIQSQMGTNARLLEQYRDDLQMFARTTNGRLNDLTRKVTHIMANGCAVRCKPPPDSLPPNEEPTNPKATSTAPFEQARVM